MKKFILNAVGVFALLGGLLAFTFGSVLFQEGNPIPLLRSIVSLELSNREYEQFFETEKHTRYVSENTNYSHFDVIKGFMKEKGWDFKEQIGSGLIFEKNEGVLVVETRQYSKYYILWDIPKEVLDA